MAVCDGDSAAAARDASGRLSNTSLSSGTADSIPVYDV